MGENFSGEEQLREGREVGALTHFIPPLRPVEYTISNCQAIPSLQMY